MITFNDFVLQGKEIGALQKQIEEKRLVHALLITGEPGTGKNTLASLVAFSLMCSAEKNKPCGMCEGCRLALSGDHPDIIVLEKGIPISPDTAKGKSTIPVDDIREVTRLCSQYSFNGANRVFIIRDVDNMTVQAQNCLLKILEEPPQNTFFILTSAHPDKLLITVKSRCRPVKLIPWPVSYIQHILHETGSDPQKAEKAAAVSGGSIGKALKLMSDDTYWNTREEVIKSFFINTKRSEVLAISSAWKERRNEADILFGILEDEVNRLLRYRLVAGEESQIADFPAEWREFAGKASPDRFTAMNDRIREARRQNDFNVNFQAIIEQLLLFFIGEHMLWIK
jgi:DNA polymerase-3 subunit delta'